MANPQIQFLQISPDDLGAIVADHVQRAIEPIIRKQVQPKDEVRRFGRKETAARLGVTLTTLWAKTKAGDIQSEVFGKRVLYTEAAIEAALRKRRFSVEGGVRQ